MDMIRHEDKGEQFPAATDNGILQVLEQLLPIDVIAKNGLPRISTRLHVVAAQDIKAAKPREIKVLAGIDMPSRGPVFVHNGHLRVIDNVPENCILVVEDGSCSVEGFVMGKIAVSGHCEVRENISGVVVARQGNVRTRNIIDKAYVVSKWGDVICRHAQSPELVFAGNEIHVEESAVTGKYIAPRISVNGQVYGGQLHVSHSAVAQKFRQSDARHLDIVLRRDISCRDYGEVPGEEASLRLGKTARIRRRMAELNDMVLCAEREAEHCAGSAIVFLMSGEANRGTIDRLQAAEHRLATLDQIIGAYQSLSLTAEEVLSTMTTQPGSTDTQPGPAVESAPSQAEADDSEGAEFATVTDNDRDLKQELEDMGNIRTKLAVSGLDKGLALSILTDIRERLTSYNEERQELIESIERWQDDLNAKLGHAAMLQSDGGKNPKTRLLRRLLKAARERPPEDPLAKRVKSGFMRVAMRTLNSHLERARECQGSIRDLRAEFAQAGEQLRKDYHIIVREERQADAPPPSATGKYEAGVKIYGDPFLLGEESPPSRTVVATPNSGDSPVTYVRTASGAVEQS